MNVEGQDGGVDHNRSQTHLHNSPSEVVIDVHFRHEGRRDVGQVEVAGLGRKARPAGGALALDGNDGRAVGAGKVG